MKNIFSALLLLLYTGLLFAQETITFNGTIKEAATGHPIAYATVSYKSAGTHGTISNDAGVFELFDVPLGVTIEISHLLYEPQTYTLTNSDSLQINLSTTTLALPTAVVDGEYARQLAQKAHEKARATKQVYKGKGFYRQLSKVDGEYTEVIESFVDIHFSNQQIESWEVIEGRYGKTKKEGIIRFNNFSFLSRGVAVYTTPPKKKKRKKKKKNAAIALSEDLNEFHVEVAQFLQKADGQEIAIIHCIPKNKGTKNNRLFIESWYYIDTETYEIYKMKSIIPEWLGDKSKLKVQEPLFTIQFTYKKDSKRGMVLDFIQVLADVEIHKNEQFPYPVAVNSLFYCYAIFDAKQDTFEKAKRKIDDLEVASKANYNPAFWENHPMLKKTPLEKQVMEDFEKAGFFGTYRK